MITKYKTKENKIEPRIKLNYNIYNKHHNGVTMSAVARELSASTD